MDASEWRVFKGDMTRDNFILLLEALPTDEDRVELMRIVLGYVCEWCGRFFPQGDSQGGCDGVHEVEEG